MTEVRRGGLLRANVWVATGTAVSRITGFVKLVALLYALGRTAVADAYNTANNSPNIVYELILGGILTATLVPIFTEQIERDDPAGTDAVVSVAAVLLAILTVIGTLAAPLIIGLYTVNTGGGVDAGQLRDVATKLALLFLPQIFFYGLSALWSAVLNAHHEFFAPAWAPVLNNLVVIAVLLIVASRFDQPISLTSALADPGLIWFLGVGTTAGIVVMTLALWPAMRRAGIRLRFRPNVRHPAVKRVLLLSGWTIGYVVSNQIALLVATILAEPGSGGVTAYQAAFLFFQLPHGLLAVSIMTTFQPGLSLAALRGDQQGFDDKLALGLRAIALATLPASALYVVLARPLVAALLEHGAFSADAVTATADVLVAFAIGLFAYSAYLFVLRGFYARQDTKTPFMLNVIENAINIVFALVLVGPYGVVGIAASFSIAYFISATLALIVLARRVGGLRLGPLAEGLVRLTLATVVAAGFAWLIVDRVGSQSGWGAVTTVLAGTTSLVAVYACGVLAFAPDELRSLAAALRPTAEPAPR